MFLVTLTSVWSALHFFLASRTLRADLAAANEPAARPGLT
jgi:hypothetical protein